MQTEHSAVKSWRVTALTTESEGDTFVVPLLLAHRFATPTPRLTARWASLADAEGV